MNYRKRIILAKKEVTYGVDAAPTGAADACLVGNLSITPMSAELVERNIILPYFGHLEQLPVGTEVRVGFDIEMVGSGAAGTVPAWGRLLKACGFNETISAGVDVVYAPISDDPDSLTIYAHMDGHRVKLLGARGGINMKITPKGIPVFSFAFTALYGGIADAALPTPTFTPWKTPIAVNNANTGAFSLHGYAGQLYDMAIDLKTQVVHRMLVGVEDVLITDRKPDGSIEIECPTIATKDFFTIAKDATLGALTITHGVTAGYKVKIDAPLVALSNPEYGDRDGVVSLKMGVRLTPSAAGNDELTVTAL